jgi:SAM-dependent methyltransferase
MPPQESSDALRARWDSAYTGGRPPWEIGRPQPAFVRLADAGEMIGPVLDAGCGTGEHALMAAERGVQAVGLDAAPTAIAIARAKALSRGIAVEFETRDLRSVGSDPSDLAWRGYFATVIDSGAFHTFDDAGRKRYVASLAALVRPAGVLHLLCFSQLTPGPGGPRRVTQAELRAAFAKGWTVERIDAERFAVNDRYRGDAPHAWLARIARAG